MGGRGSFLLVLSSLIYQASGILPDMHVGRRWPSISRTSQRSSCSTDPLRVIRVRSGLLHGFLCAETGSDKFTFHLRQFRSCSMSFFWEFVCDSFEWGKRPP